MSRPRLTAGTYGTINLVEIAGGQWRARARYRFQDGKRRQVERLGTTKAKAEKSLKDALLEIETPSTAHITRAMTLRQLADIYLQHKQDSGRALMTINTYEHNAKKHIKPGLGELTIGEATTGRLQAFIVKVQREHGHGAAKASRSVLSGMMALAVRSDAILTNPVVGVAGIEKPKGRRGSKAIIADDLGGFLSTIRKDDEMNRLDLVDLFEFMAFVGCRIGAALALRWENVDFKKGTVSFVGTVVTPTGKGIQIQEFQKTEASARTIHPPTSTMALLLRRSGEPRPNNFDVVFPSALGFIRAPNRTQADWRLNRDRLGYPDFSTQGFRKTVTDVLDAQGLSARDIADYVGHGDVAITQNVYMSRALQSTKPAKAFDDFMRQSAE
jgi:integrase